MDKFDKKGKIGEVFNLRRTKAHPTKGKSILDFYKQ
ncbi:hypothetical protein PRO82_000894 [Candidatus Protochlamydia amoebophila]|nr:hypothetical protein [Candidatus Protochlamydia amoebophila]